MTTNYAKFKKLFRRKNTTLSTKKDLVDLQSGFKNIIDKFLELTSLINNQIAEKSVFLGDYVNKDNVDIKKDFDHIYILLLTEIITHVTVILGKLIKELDEVKGKKDEIKKAEKQKSGIVLRTFSGKISKPAIQDLILSIYDLYDESVEMIAFFESQIAMQKKLKNRISLRAAKTIQDRYSNLKALEEDNLENTLVQGLRATLKSGGAEQTQDKIKINFQEIKTKYAYIKYTSAKETYLQLVESMN